MLPLFRFQLRHINHSSINTATYIIGGHWWHGIWRIRWSPNRYWRSLRLWRFFLWRIGLLLTNLVQLRWINYWIINWRRHRYHQLWQLIALWVTVVAIKELIITKECFVKSWMTVDEPRTAEMDWWLNYSMEEAQVSLVMKTCFSLSDCHCD